MSENTEPTKEAENQIPDAPLIINTQYLKDLSFEAPNSPQIFLEMKQAPEVSINIDVKALKIENNTFIVTLITNSEAKYEGKTVFICECEYAAIITLNVPAEHVEQLLLVEVPKFLFPFARQIISDATRNGGFSPLLLSPIDFLALYHAKKAESAQA